MIAIDTNILVRILVDDKGQMEQVRLARQFAAKHVSLFIPQLVQAELVWVLDFSYSLEKTEILHALQHLQENEAFVLQYATQFDAALRLFQISTISFSDCLILQAAKDMNCELITFDKKFSKLDHVKLLTH